MEKDVKSTVTANERRDEIIRILLGRRHETMGQLACELGVTTRTIRNDITILTTKYPLETVRGNGGGVKLMDWYHPHKNTLSQEHQNVLIELLDKVNEYQQKILWEMLILFGCSIVKKKEKQ